MKLIVLLQLAGLIALSSSSPVSMVPGDNSHYVEGESRYIWMPDGDDVPVLVDLEEPVDESILTTRNGANNRYWLYTRNNRNTAQIITHNTASTIWNSNYGSNRGTKVIVHGWNNDGNSRVNLMIRNAFLDVQDCNVIVVDWSGLASSSYSTAVNGVPGVGASLGNFINWLFNTAGGSMASLHLIGYSLGAHVVGSAGRTLGGRATRVTGLDPAGPLWHTNGNSLNRQAARYVEGIHTDGGFLGILTEVGHADFYPNGGFSPQPGCANRGNGNSCSHSRSFELFASSVRTNHFVGRFCTNVSQAINMNCSGASLNMGNRVLNKSGNGVYALRTGGVWPF